jgi:hypothetical protein
MYQAQYKLNISKKTYIAGTYALLYANQTVTGSIFGNGNNRGSLALAEFCHQFNKNVKFLLYGEYFTAGDFYNNEKLKSGSFFKTELTFCF